MFIINSFGARGTFSEMTTSCVARKEVSKIWSSKHVKNSLTKLKMVREKGKRKAVSPKGAIPKDIRQEMDDDDGIVQRFIHCCISMKYCETGDINAMCKLTMTCVFFTVF